MKTAKTICPLCEESIEDDEIEYVFPDGSEIHEDCLYDWARQYRSIKHYDTGEGDYCDE
jgi:hypothetical protein